jgi:hypothetical protein
VNNVPDGLDEDARRELMAIATRLKRGLAISVTEGFANALAYPDDPEMPPAYRVCRAFRPQGLGGVRAERDEILVPAARATYWSSGHFWADLVIRDWWVDEGLVAPLVPGTLMYGCPCARVWATVEARTVHGCMEAPASQEPVESSGEQAGIPVRGFPTRPKVQDRWRDTWKLIKRHSTRYTIDELMGWLNTNHKDYFCSRDTLGKIIRAGLLGLLD